MMLRALRRMTLYQPGKLSRHGYSRFSSLEACSRRWSVFHRNLDSTGDDTERPSTDMVILRVGEAEINHLLS